VIGSKGGKKGKKQKAVNSTTDKAFNIDFTAIGKFGLVQVSPPISPEELDSKIEELTQKQKKFAEEG
jgi:hypothetical protein